MRDPKAKTIVNRALIKEMRTRKTRPSRVPPAPSASSRPSPPPSPEPVTKKA